MQGHQIYTPPMTRINKYLIIGVVSFFILESFLSKVVGVSLLPYLGLSLSGLSKGMVFQFITYPFYNTGLFSMVFECLLLWFIGCELEALWGERFYLKFLIFCVLGAAATYLVLAFLFSSMGHYVGWGAPFVGMYGIGYSLLFAYAILFPDRQFSFLLIFPMKAKYFCLLLGGITLYMALFSSFSRASWGHLGAMVCGVVYLRFVAHQIKAKREGKTSFQWGNLFKKGTSKKKRVNRQGLYIVKDDDDKPKKKFYH